MALAGDVVQRPLVAGSADKLNRWNLMASPLQQRIERTAVRTAMLGMLTNGTLATVKFIGAILGNTYALIADAAESMTDIFSSFVVWSGLSVAIQPPDSDHPYGHGKAEPLAASFVSLTLLAAALGIAIQAVREILTPHL